MTTFNCRLNLNNTEIAMLTVALEAYIREYDKRNLLQPWNKQYKDLAIAVKRRLHRDSVMVNPAAGAGTVTGPTLDTERRNSRPAVSAHSRHNRKKDRIKKR